MKQFFTKSFAIALLFSFTVTFPLKAAEPESGLPSQVELLSQIKTLTEQLLALQKQLATTQAQGKTVGILKNDLQEGVTDDNVRDIQKLLASDSSIYPEGLVTGYYGPLTREALKRFQAQHSLEVTGTIDNGTRGMLQEFLNKAQDYGGITPGFISTPAIVKEVTEIYLVNCKEKYQVAGALDSSCDRNVSDIPKVSEAPSVTEVPKIPETPKIVDVLKSPVTQTVIPTIEETDKAMSNQFNVIVTRMNSNDYLSGITTITFQFGDGKYVVQTTDNTELVVLQKVADRLNIKVSMIHPDLKREILNKLSLSAVGWLGSEVVQNVESVLIQKAQNAVKEAELSINDAIALFVGDNTSISDTRNRQAVDCEGILFKQSINYLCQETKVVSEVKERLMVSQSRYDSAKTSLKKGDYKNAIEFANEAKKNADRVIEILKI